MQVNESFLTISALTHALLNSPIEKRWHAVHVFVSQASILFR